MATFKSSIENSALNSEKANWVPHKFQLVHALKRDDLLVRINFVNEDKFSRKGMFNRKICIWYFKEDTKYLAF